MTELLTDVEYEDVTPPQSSTEPSQDAVYSIEGLAQQIVKEAMGANVALATRIDAFKALSAYRLGMMKKGKEPDDEKDNVEGFNTIRDRIKQAG